MSMVEEGRVKAKKRYDEKLKLPEKYLIHQALIQLPDEIKHLKAGQEQLKGYLDEWKAKCDKLKEEKDSIVEENKNGKKEIKKLKKLLKEKSDMKNVENEETSPTKTSPAKASPTKRKKSKIEVLKSQQEDQQLAKKRRIDTNAPFFNPTFSSDCLGLSFGIAKYIITAGTI